jgi:hypothetical protein
MATRPKAYLIGQRTPVSGGPVRQDVPLRGRKLSGFLCRVHAKLGVNPTTTSTCCYKPRRPFPLSPIAFQRKLLTAETPGPAHDKRAPTRRGTRRAGTCYEDWGHSRLSHHRGMSGSPQERTFSQCPPLCWFTYLNLGGRSDMSGSASRRTAARTASRPDAKSWRRE